MKKVFIPAMLSIFSLALSPVTMTSAAPVATATNAHVVLKNNEAKAASHGKMINHKNATDVVSVTLTLNLRNRAQLDKQIADMYNPASPNYKKYLTPAQFAAQYGPTAADVQAVTDFAKASGLKVTNIAKGNQAVTVSGTVGQLEAAFGTTINNYADANGHAYFANATAPSVPSQIAGVVNGVVGLDNEAHFHNHIDPSVTGHSGAGPAGGFTPTQLRSAYDSTTLNASYNGSGQNVAVVEFDGYVASNVTTYVNNYSLGSPAPINHFIDGYNGAAGSGEPEVELDIEIINAMAPAAQVNVYEAPNSDQGMLDMYQQIANDNTSKTISISWGECEALASTATMNSLDSILAQMASQGQSVYAAAGDNGAYDCGSNAPTTLSVDNPANDPYVTGVGGTNLVLTSANAWSSETVWSNSLYREGGGGGVSKLFKMPSWQTGTGVQNSYSTGYREVPDVSADADPNTGYSIYSQGAWTVYGGTSCAAPLWAGITALNNQYAISKGKATLGQANPTLYRLFNTTQTYKAYHDITSGKNLYYPATTGYDLASGIGTPDAYNIVRDING